ncbi:MAG TPA: glycosyltransferase family 9 protein [Bacteroidota bacterium]|nr:glycosyltransferase family 9 protein [Bacteroidota bacterium]
MEDFHYKTHEGVSAVPWTAAAPPSRILIMRFHAIGDVALTFPALSWLRKRWPESRLEFLTMAPAGESALSLPIFDDVIIEPSPEGKVERIRFALRAAHLLRSRKFDLIIDLQRNWVSRFIRRACMAPSYTEFERFTPVPAARSVLKALEDGGMHGASHHFPVPITMDALSAARARLDASGYVEGAKLIVLNPAGLWRTRNWPIENYVQLGRLWREREPVQFMVLGTERIRAQAALFKRELGPNVIDFAGKTSLAEAFAIVRFADVIVTEDSGLMHMAWAAGVPVVALFGSSMHYRSSPEGKHVICLHSGDLPCGACMDPECRFADVHCLSRYRPDMVLEAAQALLSRPELPTRAVNA